MVTPRSPRRANLHITYGFAVDANQGSRRTPRPLRIMFCIDSMEVGGTELNAVRTAERLDRSRFELGVVCLRTGGPLAGRYEAAGIPLFHFPIPSLYGPGTARQGMRLARFLREQRVDVFHAHDRYSNVFGVPWARLAGIPRVIASRRWWEERKGAKHRVANRLAYRLAHAVLANSSRVAELLTRAEGVAPHKVAVVPNFIDPSAFVPPDEGVRRQFFSELGLPWSAPVIGIIANLRPVKDHPSLLRALALLRPRWPDVRLVLVGEGDSRSALESLAAELGIRDRVHFAGRRPNHPNLHHFFDVSVLCSVSEGLSNSVLEAMAAGNPVVATDVGATADAVLDGQTGILVPPSDVPQLSEAVERLLRDPQLARTMGEQGLRQAREHFSMESAFRSLARLYTGKAGESAALEPRALLTNLTGTGV